MKKILIISSRVPYPTIGGDRSRVYHIAQVLAGKYRVDLLAVNERKIAREELEPLKGIFNNLILFDFGLGSIKINAGRNILSSRPMQVTGYYFKEIRRWIKQHYKEYQLLYVNHIRMAEYVRGLPCKKVLDFHDAISMNYKDAQKKANRFWRAFYLIEGRKLLPYEVATLRNFDKYFITSKVDRDYLLARAPVHTNIEVIPMGVNQQALERAASGEKEENWLAFLGKMDYQPNEDAALHFAKDIFPLLQQEDKKLKFVIIGAYPTRRVRALARINGIEVTGFVDDPYELLGRAKVVVAPMRFGAGIQNKVLEAMALRKPVVTTSNGAQGIAGRDGRHFIVADSPEETIREVLLLLNDERRRGEIGRNARALIEKEYTWDVVGAKLLQEIEEII